MIRNTFIMHSIAAISSRPPLSSPCSPLHMYSIKPFPSLYLWPLFGILSP